MSENQAIEEFYTENRTFPPLETFASNALLTDSQIYNEASEDYESFWAKQARELLTWHKDFTNTLEWNLPYAKWFSDGELNISYNCLDRHIENGKGSKVAYHWEGRTRGYKNNYLSRVTRRSIKICQCAKGIWAQKK